MTSIDQNANLMAKEGDEGGEPKECLASVTFPVESVYVFKTVDPANKPCPAPTAGNLASAINSARTKLLDIGKAYCAFGNSDCTSNNCLASLSDFVVQSTVISSRLTDDNKKQCIITVKATGKISCFCMG